MLYNEASPNAIWRSRPSRRRSGSVTTAASTLFTRGQQGAWKARAFRTGSMAAWAGSMRGLWKGALTGSAAVQPSPVRQHRGRDPPALIGVVPPPSG